MEQVESIGAGKIISELQFTLRIAESRNQFYVSFLHVMCGVVLFDSNDWECLDQTINWGSQKSL